MNIAQLNYIRAKAISDALQKEFNQRTFQLWDDVADLEANIEIIAAEAGVDEELGIWEAHDALLAAEKELIEWAYGRIQTDSRFKEHEAEIRMVFENYRHVPSIRQKVIDLCLRLE